MVQDKEKNSIFKKVIDSVRDFDEMLDAAHKQGGDMPYVIVEATPYPININEVKAPTRFTNFSNDELLIFRTALMNYWFIVATRFADSSYSVYVSLLDSLSDEILKRGLNNG